MDLEKIRAKTSDNLFLDGLLYKSENNAKTIIINIHGTAGNFYIHNFIDKMSVEYTKNNIDFMAVNNRGHDFVSEFQQARGKNTKIIGYAYERFEDCIYDIKAWLDFASRLKYKNIILQGHSLGAIKATYYVYKTNDKRVNGLILASPPDIVGLFSKREKPVSMINDLLFTKNNNSFQLISKRTFEELKKIDGPADIFNTYDPKKKSAIEKINIPIFAFFGSMNEATIMKPIKALEILYKKSQKTNFNFKIINGANHIYYKKEKTVAKEVTKWIKQNFN
ncbi:MAG: alpha/beta hydrolase [Candidatus Parvarchaeota archaeon]|nr:alpha/beta hydrolase [Candidatus Parvarchaeota archaeon]MCW1294327.1 alpha/beta hydrolase [Candidatus Parvarchaeum tengchongense]MCW1295210.1 alpha/beta hydrolase [Candidatus Parvarchaeum tengchongense]MCW1299575.1 alpha/beta hydrolase [Candidatus Parvarchaeum tengchongense]MCW1312253.1 alpha/beta hydrolase [Candidatus Parvarchaeum tengchongense]